MVEHHLAKMRSRVRLPPFPYREITVFHIHAKTLDYQGYFLFSFHTVSLNFIKFDGDGIQNGIQEKEPH